MSIHPQYCDEEGNSATFVQCFRNQLKAHHQELNISCVSHIFAEFLYPAAVGYDSSSNRSIRLCGRNEESEAMIHFYQRYRNLLINYSRKENPQDLICKIPCSIDYFSVTQTKLTLMSENRKMSNVDTILYLAGATDFVMLTTQLRQYDLNSIIAAIGGGIGIFLGYSCLGLASRIFNYFLRKANKPTD